MSNDCEVFLTYGQYEDNDEVATHGRGNEWHIKKENFFPDAVSLFYFEDDACRYAIYKEIEMNGENIEEILSHYGHQRPNNPFDSDTESDTESESSDDDEIYWTLLFELDIYNVRHDKKFWSMYKRMFSIEIQDLETFKNRWHLLREKFSLLSTENCLTYYIVNVLKQRIS